MTNLQQPVWKQIPIDATTLSKVCKNTARRNGYNTLGQLLSVRLTTLIKLEWFNLAMLNEMGSLVKGLQKKR
jgi:DNA-directed RNA polymerase alpha subunit